MSPQLEPVPNSAPFLHNPPPQEGLFDQTFVKKMIPTSIKVLLHEIGTRVLIHATQNVLCWNWCLIQCNTLCTYIYICVYIYIYLSLSLSSLFSLVSLVSLSAVFWLHSWEFSLSLSLYVFQCFFFFLSLSLSISLSFWLSCSLFLVWPSHLFSFLS